MDSRLYIVLCQLYLFMKRKSLCRMIKKQSRTKSIDILWIANICFSFQASLFWKTIGSKMTTTHCCLFILCYFFIVFLTHMHNRLVSMTCTRYRSNADDSTLFNCCCRSMALLNFSTHIRLINQMLLFICLFLDFVLCFLLHREVLIH